MAVVVAFGGAIASIKASSALVTSPYIQYTSGVGSANPTCTISPGSCDQTVNGANCVVRVQRNGVLISTTYASHEAPIADPGPCGPVTTHTSSAFVGTKNIQTTGAVILQ